VQYTNVNAQQLLVCGVSISAAFVKAGSTDFEVSEYNIVLIASIVTAVGNSNSYGLMGLFFLIFVHFGVVK